MSLESQIAALVAASNNLTQSVNDKIDEIDTQVQAAIKAIPELNKVFYIDSVAGNDNVAGTEVSPLKTIKAAVERTPQNGSVLICVKRNQDHVMSGSQASVIDVTNKVVTISSYGAGNKPVIKMHCINTDVGSIAYGFMVSIFSVITVIDCVIDTGSLPLGAVNTYDMFGGFVSRMGTTGEVGTVQLTLSYCDVMLRDHQLSSHYGRVDYNFRAVKISHVGKQVHLNSGGDTFHCTLNGVTLTDTTKTLWRCLRGATASNTLTNISMA